MTDEELRACKRQFLDKAASSSYLIPARAAEAIKQDVMSLFQAPISRSATPSIPDSDVSLSSSSQSTPSLDVLEDLLPAANPSPPEIPVAPTPCSPRILARWLGNSRSLMSPLSKRLCSFFAEYDKEFEAFWSNHSQVTPPEFRFSDFSYLRWLDGNPVDEPDRAAVNVFAAEVLFAAPHTLDPVLDLRLRNAATFRSRE
jgi:hypothetical protein